ncbi:50S ribosomal protein L5 [bacterium]|nr:50S ribosomal protein L5 [bacterium]
MPPDYRPRLYTDYLGKYRAELKAEMALGNVMQVPRLEKIVLNMGVGEGARDEKIIVMAEEDLAKIAGQKPRRNKSRIAVANFKLRKGMPVGSTVTLRGWRMYEFLERLINVAIPRIRDFRGLPPRSFDGHGNYSFGIREHIIFTEIEADSRPQTFGMDVTFVTSATGDDGCRRLLRKFGMPLRES